MEENIDIEFWNSALCQPTWYELLHEEFDRVNQLASDSEDTATRRAIKERVYTLIENALANNRIPLASSGDDLDERRKAIDTVVIHHTKNLPGMTLERLNAMQLLRIYGTYFYNPTDPIEKHLKGQAVWSNHFYKSKQVYWCYHWLVRENGEATQILKDNYIGWHAANWDINTRSIAICVDDDLSHKEPGIDVLSSIATLINETTPYFLFE